jgi:hypothetical protein
MQMAQSHPRAKLNEFNNKKICFFSHAVNVDWRKVYNIFYFAVEQMKKNFPSC